MPTSFSPLITLSYVSKQYVEEVHFQSEPFKKLQGALGGLEWVEAPSMKMYKELDVGF